MLRLKVDNLFIALLTPRNQVAHRRGHAGPEASRGGKETGAPQPGHDIPHVNSRASLYISRLGKSGYFLQHYLDISDGVAG